MIFFALVLLYKLLIFDNRTWLHLFFLGSSFFAFLPFISVCDDVVKDIVCLWVYDLGLYGWTFGVFPPTLSSAGV